MVIRKEEEDDHKKENDLEKRISDSLCTKVKVVVFHFERVWDRKRSPNNKKSGLG